jgi:hypothetical protein
MSRITFGTQQKKSFLCVLMPDPGPVKCLCIYIALVISLAISLPPLLIFWIPYAVYYDGSTLFNFYPLMIKYATQGVTLPGRVLAKRDKEATDGFYRIFTYFVKVKYQFNENYYVREFTVPEKIWRTADTGGNLDVIILPDYPRSAALVSFVKTADPDVPPTSSRIKTITSVLMIIYFFVISALLFIERDRVLLAMVLACGGTVVLGFTVAYWTARWDQHQKLNFMLHGAHWVLPNVEDTSTKVVLPKTRVSYFDLCPEARHSLLDAVAVVVQDIGGALLLVFYVCLLGGGHCVWRASLQWKRRLIERYDSSKSSHAICRVMGSIVCKEGGDTVIVQYKVGNQTYKKRMDAPVKVGDTMSDTSLELLYLMGLPKSATYQAWVTKQLSSMAKSRQIEAVWALIVMTAQIAIFWASLRQSVPHPKGTFVGMVTLCYLALSFVTYWILYRTIDEKYVLYSAKDVVVVNEVNVSDKFGPDSLEEASNDTSVDTSVDTNSRDLP